VTQPIIQDWGNLSPEEKAKVFEREKLESRAKLIEGNLRSVGSLLTQMEIPEEKLLLFRVYFEDVLVETHRAYDEAVKKL
jgi:hypothetical protein